MKRYITEKLIEWKNGKYRKPLIVRGVRQVGKTYILKQFGKDFYEDVAYFNFDYDKEIIPLFDKTKNPNWLLEQLSFFIGKKINPGTTLILFDEIQECPNALNSLKYFCENANEYHIVCASSLLRIRVANTSFPVGKVDFLNLYPMTFTEYLMAEGSENLVEYMNQLNNIEEIPSTFHNQLIEKLKIYYIVGGMPEVVSSWAENRDIELVDKIQQNILNAYESDFSKHILPEQANKVSLIWNGIPSQLAKDNKKFVYQSIKKSARAREYEGALNWLNDADLITKCYRVNKYAFPLKAYQDLSAFKIYMCDVGLLRKMSELDSRIIVQGNTLLEEFKGSFSENYVANTLRYLFEHNPSYYVFNNYEIDFMIQTKNEIIPIEVKSNKKNHHKSLTEYNKENDNIISIRFSLDNLKKDGKTLNVPLYMIEYFEKFIF